MSTLSSFIFFYSFFAKILDISYDGVGEFAGAQVAAEVVSDALALSQQGKHRGSTYATSHGASNLLLYELERDIGRLIL